MGSEWEILQTLKQNPTALCWDKPKVVKIRRNSQQHLGIVINTYKSGDNGTDETFTAVTRVKDSCVPKNRQKISVGCRIVEIDSTSVVTWDFRQVVEKLQHLQIKGKSHAKFKICLPLMSRLVPQFSSQGSRHSDTLPPVETPDPVNMPIFGRRNSPATSSKSSSRVENFTSLSNDNSDDDSAQETLADVAIKSPWMIRWFGTESVEIIKTATNKPRIGLTYKYKHLASDKEQNYCIVESVEPGGPSFGVLRPGYLILSVNGQPIQNETGLLNEIQACDDNRIKMIIQKPRDILPDSRSTRGSGHNDSYNSQALREPGKRLAVPAVRISKPDGKSSSESRDTRSYDTRSHEARSHDTRSHDTRSHDVKSQRSQASNGRKPHTSGDGNVSMTSGARAIAYIRADISVKPATAARGRSVCDDSVVTSVSGSVHVKSFQRGHRRNHSDSSSMFYTQQQQQAINQSTERGQGQARRGSESMHMHSAIYSDPAHIDLSLEKCLSSWSNVLHRKQLDHFPYVRLVQINTGNQHNEHLHLQLMQLLNVKRGLRPCDFADKCVSRGTFAISESRIRSIDNLSQTNSIEELVLAKHAASYLKEHPFVLKNLNLCWQVLKKSKCRLQRLMGQFLQQPPTANENFTQVEAINLTFNEVCQAESSVLFSENCIFVVVVDIEKLSSLQAHMEEIARIKICLNNIRMVSRKVQVYFMVGPHTLDVECERNAAESIDALITSFKQICGCGQGLLEFVENRKTDHQLFNIDEHSSVLAEQLFSSVENVVHPISGYKRFPLLALKLYRELEKQRFGMPMTIQTQLTETLLQLSPSLNHKNVMLHDMLSSLHSAGKILYPGSLKHHAVGQQSSLKFLQMFIVHPQFVVTCAHILRSKLTLLQPYSEKHLLRTLSHHNSMPEDYTVLSFLHLLHVVEQPAIDRYHVSAPVEDLQSFAPHDVHSNGALLRFDFDNFLPSYMLPYLMCELAQRTKSNLEFITAQSAVISSQQPYMSTYLHFDLASCVARITVSGWSSTAMADLFQSTLPTWMVVHPDVQPTNSDTSLTGMHHSLATCTVSLTTPVNQLPTQLLHLISCHLHPYNSSHGGDVRLLAEKLLTKKLLPQQYMAESAATTLIHEWTQEVPSATLQDLLHVICLDVGREDIGREVHNWIGHTTQYPAV